jgi:hypothetical protein
MGQMNVAVTPLAWGKWPKITGGFGQSKEPSELGLSYEFRVIYYSSKVVKNPVLRAGSKTIDPAILTFWLSHFMF